MAGQAHMKCARFKSEWEKVKFCDFAYTSLLSIRVVLPIFKILNIVGFWLSLCKIEVDFSTISYHRQNKLASLILWLDFWIYITFFFFKITA